MRTSEHSLEFLLDGEWLPCKVEGASKMIEMGKQ